VHNEAQRAQVEQIKSRASSTRSVPGRGMEGVLRGVPHRLGTPEWALELCPQLPPPAAPGQAGRWILLADDEGPLAWFALRDELREDAQELVACLGELGIVVELLSGDASPSVVHLAEQLGIERAIAGATPEQKVEYVRALQQAGGREPGEDDLGASPKPALAVMVGDGVNDAPVLAQAQISIAMGGGSDLARVSADAVLLGDRLGVLCEAVRWARKTRRIVRQNLAWALLYNATVLPLAALGYIAPYMAAIGMSASSLLVVANALRLGEVRSRS
jgi:Cu2+-exporting ATPase